MWLQANEVAPRYLIARRLLRTLWGSNETTESALTLHHLQQSQLCLQLAGDQLPEGSTVEPIYGIRQETINDIWENGTREQLLEAIHKNYDPKNQAQIKHSLMLSLRLLESLELNPNEAQTVTEHCIQLANLWHQKLTPDLALTDGRLKSPEANELVIRQARALANLAQRIPEYTIPANLLAVSL